MGIFSKENETQHPTDINPSVTAHEDEGDEETYYRVTCYITSGGMTVFNRVTDVDTEQEGYDITFQRDGKFVGVFCDAFIVEEL